MPDIQKLRLIDKTTRLDRALDEIAIFLAAAAFVALLIATYGIDLSPGLF